MIQNALIPEKTVISAKGDGPAVEIMGGAGHAFLLILSITRIVEQESLEIGIYGSTDAATWDPKPIATFPQKFYCGEYPMLLDLRGHSNPRFIRAHWEVGRWGRGTETPMFECSLTLKEIPSEVLNQAHAAKALA